MLGQAGQSLRPLVGPAGLADPVNVDALVVGTERLERGQRRRICLEHSGHVVRYRDALVRDHLWVLLGYSAVVQRGSDERRCRTMRTPSVSLLRLVRPCHGAPTRPRRRDPDPRASPCPVWPRPRASTVIIVLGPARLDHRCGTRRCVGDCFPSRFGDHLGRLTWAQPGEMRGTDPQWEVLVQACPVWVRWHLAAADGSQRSPLLDRRWLITVAGLGGV